MLSIEDLSREYNSKLTLYDQLKVEALFVLGRSLSSTDIKLHSTMSRVKDRDSFLDKVQRKQSSEPFKEIQDIVGLRVVCLFLSDVTRIGSLIRESFSVLSEDNKIEGADASSFGYMSVHFIATMRDEYSGPRYDLIAKLPFEIQVRTIAMDAWANVSHYLDYKSDKDVPSDLKRDFYALSGLFYVADKHFEMFYASRIASQHGMDRLFDQASPEERAEQEINLDSLTAYLSRRFPDRRASNPKAVSLLVSELSKAGYKSIGDVDQTVNRAMEAFKAYEQEHPPMRGSYNPVGIVRGCASLIDKNFVEIYYISHFTEESEGVQNEAIKSAEGEYAKFRSLVRH